MKTLFRTAMMALALTATPALAQISSNDPDWQVILTDDDNAVYRVRIAEWVEISGITQDAWVWINVDHSRDATTATRSSTFKFRVDCVGQRYQVTNTVSHDAYRQTLARGNFKVTYGWEDVIPGTVAEGLHQAVCV